LQPKIRHYDGLRRASPKSYLQVIGLSVILCGLAVIADYGCGGGVALMSITAGPVAWFA
jgi:hypothetical protein